jgi:hypothetical protein
LLKKISKNGTRKKRKEKNKKKEKEKRKEKKPNNSFTPHGRTVRN